jgi:hypothetical protein
MDGQAVRAIPTEQMRMHLMIVDNTTNERSINFESSPKNRPVCICVTILYWELNCRTKVSSELQLPRKLRSIWMQLWLLAPIPHRRTLVNLICFTLCTSTRTALTGHLTELVAADIAAVAVVHPEWLEDVPAYIYEILVVASKMV